MSGTKIIAPTPNLPILALRLIVQLEGSVVHPGAGQEGQEVELRGVELLAGRGAALYDGQPRVGLLGGSWS